MCVYVCIVHVWFMHVYTVIYLYLWRSEDVGGLLLLSTLLSTQGPSFSLKLTDFTKLADHWTSEIHLPPHAGLTGTLSHIQLLHRAGDSNSSPCVWMASAFICSPISPAQGYLKQLVRGTCGEGCTCLSIADASHWNHCVPESNICVFLLRFLSLLPPTCPSLTFSTFHPVCDSAFYIRFF